MKHWEFSDAVKTLNGRVFYWWEDGKYVMCCSLAQHQALAYAAGWRAWAKRRGW